MTQFTWLQTFWGMNTQTETDHSQQIQLKPYGSLPLAPIPNDMKDLKRFSRPELFGRAQFDRQR